MSEVLPAPDITSPAEPVTPPTKAKRASRLGLSGWMAAIWLTLITAAALLAPFLPLDDPRITDFALPNNASPGQGGHLFGTDENGYDVLSRIVWGGRVSLIVAFGVLLLGMTIGGLVGVLAGYFRGRIEALLMAVVDIFLAFPSLILLIAVVAFLGADLKNVVIGISLVSIPAFARIARATTLTFAQREFVLAARAAGAGNGRILVREILPNVVLPLLAFGLLVVAIAIVAEGSLAFLGLTSADTISWGGMINGGRRPLQEDNVAHVAMIPSFVMFLTVLSVNFLGDRFRSVFDVKDTTL